MVGQTYIDIYIHMYIATGAIQLINAGLAQAGRNNGACHQRSAVFTDAAVLSSLCKTAHHTVMVESM